MFMYSGIWCIFEVTISDEIFIICEWHDATYCTVYVCTNPMRINKLMLHQSLHFNNKMVGNV